MKKIIGLVMLCIGLMVSCDLSQWQGSGSTSQQSSRDAALLDGLADEMDEIYTTLDEVNRIDAELRNNPNISKADAVQRIKTIQKLLKNRSRTIDSLNREIGRLESHNSRLAQSYIDDGKRKLALQAQYYAELETEINRLQTENITLQDIIKQKDQQLFEKDEIIDRIQAERDVQEKKLEILNDEMQRTKRNLDSTIAETAGTYYDLAIDLKNMADKTSSLFNKKKKRLMVTMAYEFFEKSLKLGYADAEKQMREMENKKEFARYLNDNPDDDNDTTETN